MARRKTVQTESDEAFILDRHSAPEGDFTKLGTAWANVVERWIEDIEDQMETLNMPTKVRTILWSAITSTALGKAILLGRVDNG